MGLGVAIGASCGEFCCLKNASVVAALVSDSRRGVGFGGESPVGSYKRPIDSLFNRFLRRRRS
jgi:hypothetical protein